MSLSGSRDGGKGLSPWAGGSSHGAFPRQVTADGWMGMFKARKSKGLCNGTICILLAVRSLAGS